MATDPIEFMKDFTKSASSADLKLLPTVAEAIGKSNTDSDFDLTIAIRELAGITPESSFQSTHARDKLTEFGFSPEFADTFIAGLDRGSNTGQLRREATLAHREGTTKTAAALSVQRTSATDLARRRRARGVGGSNDPDSLLSTGGGGGGGLFS